MSIHRTQAGGGTFAAPLAVNARLTFVPVKPPKGKSPRKLELTGNFTFPAVPISWSFKGGARGTPNFWPGWSPEGVKQQVGAYCVQCEPERCHSDPSTGKMHCTGPIYACGEGTYCP